MGRLQKTDPKSASEAVGTVAASTGKPLKRRFVRHLMALAVSCCAMLLTASCGGGSVDEEESNPRDDESGQVSVEDQGEGPDETVPSELELRRGVVLVASDGQGFQPIGLTETITDLSTGRYSKTIEIGGRVTTVIADESTAFVGSDDRRHWIRFDAARMSGSSSSYLPVDEFVDTSRAPTDPATLSIRRTGMLSQDGRQLVINSLETRASGRQVQMRTMITSDAGSTAIAEVSEPVHSDSELPVPQFPRSSIPAEAVYLSRDTGPQVGATGSPGVRGLIRAVVGFVISDANAQTGSVVCEIGVLVSFRTWEIVCTQDGEVVHSGETIQCGYYEWHCEDDNERALEGYAEVVELYRPDHISSYCAHRMRMVRSRHAAGPSNAIGSLMADAAERAACPVPPGTTPAETTDHQDSVVTGDPHIVTADGVAYDFQSAGEFVLYRRADFEVQQRFEGGAGTMTSVQASAVRLGGHVLEVGNSESRDANDDGVPVRVDGRETRLDYQGVYFENGAMIAREAGGNGRTVIAVSPSGDAVRIESGGASQDLTLFLVQADTGSSGGLAGTPNGQQEDDFVTRQGEQVSSSDTRTVDGLYRRFGESWRLLENERLFTDRPFDDFRTEEYLRLPDRYPSLAGFSAEERAEAEGRCRAAGVPDGPALQDCAFDVLADPSRDWASQAASSSATIAKNGGDISPFRSLSQTAVTGGSAGPLSALDRCLSHSCDSRRESRTDTEHACHGMDWLSCDYRGLDTSGRQLCQRADGFCERDDQCCGGMSCNDQGRCADGQRGDRCSSTYGCGGTLVCVKDGQELGYCGVP